MKKYSIQYCVTPLCGIQIALGGCMEQKSEQNLVSQSYSQMRSCAMAILFLRLFIGAVMLLHIIGKMQTYDNLVLEYPSILGFSPATSLALSMIFQAAFAAMIMIGVATRFVSLAMMILTLLTIVRMMQVDGMTIFVLKINFLYLGFYTTLLISGSGVYGFNVPRMGGKSVPNS